MTIKFKIVVVGGSERDQEILLLEEKNITKGEKYQTNLGLDFKLSYKLIEGKDVNLVLWLMKGEKFKKIKRNFLEGADGIVILFDASQEESIDAITSQIQKIRDSSPNSSVLLIGRNVRSRVNQIIENYAQKLIKDEKIHDTSKLNIDFFDVLEKNGIDPEEFLDFLTKKLLSRL